MSDAGKAVFLSYASQDAEAAKRICEALRAAGVEVWFDQNELVGGDAWDAKIRKQIKECALLIPIISENTQARTEGYFRLEWRLADQRTHLMAKGRAFLLPVVIDSTKDSDAHVPDSFLEVQWTKALGGEVPPAFVARVQKLLSGGTTPPVAGGGDPGASPVAAGPGSTPPATVPVQRPRLIVPAAVAGVVAVAVVAAVLLLRPSSQTTKPNASVTPAAAAPVSEARKLANQAMQLLEDPNFTRETSFLADELCQRALALDAGDAEVWAIASFASSNLYVNTYDPSAERREKARSQAARASQLDPQSVRAALAVIRCLSDRSSDAEALRLLRDLHRRAPDDQEVIRSLVLAERRAGNEAEVQSLLRDLRALPRTGVLPLTLWFEDLALRRQGRYVESEAIIDEMLNGPVPLRGAQYEKLNLLMRSWHDLADAGAFIETIPARFRQEPAFGSAIATYHLWVGKPEQALAALAQVPQDFFAEYAAREPKGYLAGWAHALAGRSAAAQAEWRSGLALVDERLKTDGRNYPLLGLRAVLLALTHQKDAAREAWQLRVELGGEQNPPLGLQEAEFRMALEEREAAIAALEQRWSTLPPGNRGWNLPEMRFHPAFAPIRDDPRVQRLIAEGIAVVQQLKQGSPATAATAPAVDEKSVAVLAFANLSDDKANEYFSDGVSDELIGVLQKVPGVRVAARTSAFSFKGRNATAQEVGAKLGVARIVEGSVQRIGSRVKVSVHLSRADNGEELWAKTYTREIQDVFALQEELALAIVGELRGRLAGEDSAAVKTALQGGTTNSQALDAYLRAQYHRRRATQVDVELALREYTRALEIDPNFALAWCGLASAHIWITSFGSDFDRPGFERHMTEARRAAARALELGPDLPEALHARAMCRYSFDYNWKGAQSDLARARVLAPTNAEVFQWAGQLAQAMGERKQSQEFFRQAVALDPLSAPARSYLAFGLALARDVEGAAAEYTRTREINAQTPWARAGDGFALLVVGRPADALAATAGEPAEWAQLVVVALAYHDLGRRAESDAALATLKEKYAAVAAYQVAEVYGYRGENDAAFHWLELARDQFDAGIGMALPDPLLDKLHADPRWPAFLRTVNLAPDQLK